MIKVYLNKKLIKIKNKINIEDIINIKKL